MPGLAVGGRLQSGTRTEFARCARSWCNKDRSSRILWKFRCRLSGSSLSGRCATESSDQLGLGVASYEEAAVRFGEHRRPHVLTGPKRGRGCPCRNQCIGRVLTRELGMVTWVEFPRVLLINATFRREPPRTLSGRSFFALLRFIVFHGLIVKAGTRNSP